MKRLVFIISSLFFCLTSYAQLEFQYNKRINGYWGKWTKAYTSFPYTGTILKDFEFEGSLSDFVIYKEYNHPSDHILHVQIYGVEVPDKKTLKKNKGKYLEYDYKGIIEFYTDTETLVNEFPAIASANKPDLKKQKLSVDVTVMFKWNSKYAIDISYNFFIYKNGLGIYIPRGYYLTSRYIR